MRLSVAFIVLLFFLCAIVVEFGFTPFAFHGSPRDLGLTLDRKDVIRSCLGNSSVECGYPVFFDFSVKLEKHDFSDSIPKSLNSIPVQMLSNLSFILSANREHKCPLDLLEIFVKNSRNFSESMQNTGTLLLVPVPSEFNWCFQTSLNQQTLFLFAKKGQIPGYMSCVKRIAEACDIAFSRVVYQTDEKGSALIERVSIGSFSSTEAAELFNDFPKFDAQGNSSIEESLFNALSWVHDLFSSGTKRI